MFSDICVWLVTNLDLEKLFWNSAFVIFLLDPKLTLKIFIFLLNSAFVFWVGDFRTLSDGGNKLVGLTEIFAADFL